MEPLDPAQPMQDNSGILGTGTDRHSAFADSTQIGSPIPDSSGQESLPILGPELVPVDATEVLSGFPVLKNGGEFSSLVAAGANTPQGIDPLTGSPLVTTADLPSLSLPLLSTETLLSDAKSQATTLLSQLIDTPALLADLHAAFGENWSPNDAEALVRELANGEGWPRLVVLESSVLDANGAFSQETNTIYVSREFLSRHAGNSDAVTSVLLEEVGHYIDSKLNRTDSQGDEGQLFAALVQGIPLDSAKLAAIAAEDDSRFITINDRQYLVEESTATEPLTFGSTVNGLISGAGDLNQYTFSLSEPSKLYIDVLSYDNRTNWSLTNSSGNFIDGGSLGVDGYVFQPLLNLDAGDYVLKIDLKSTFTGAYSLRVLDLAEAAPITPNTTVNDTVSVNGQVNLYQFQALAGDRFNLNIQNLSGNINTQWKLIGPNGGELYSDVLKLPQSGIYTLLVEGYIYSGDSGNYSLNLKTITSQPPEPLTIGNTISGEISTFGVQNSYTFKLTENSKLYFDFLTAQTSLTWSLRGPNGSIISNKDVRYSDWDYNYDSPSMNLVAGDYTLTIEGSTGNAKGTYQFRLLDIAAATEINIGTPVSGILSPSSETDLYQFSATAGQHLYFDIQSRSGESYNASWRLLAPDGSQVFMNRGSDIAPTLSQTGTYTLLFEGYSFDGGSGSYSFNIQPVINPAPESIIIGNTISGSIPSPAIQQSYIFNLSADSKLYFDFLTAQTSLTWSLSGPNGSIISNKDVRYSDYYNYSTPIMSLGAGDYTLTIDGIGDSTGYQFRLLDIAAATEIIPGTPVSGTLSPSSETDLYRFNATAGQILFFDSQFRNDEYNSANWRLLDPDGSQVFMNSGSDFTLTLLKTGTYTLLIEGYPFDGGSGSYSFNIHPPEFLTIGNTINGKISTFREQNSYTFNLTENSKLYFDFLTAQTNLTWSLGGPNGSIISNKDVRYSDWDYIYYSPLMNLVAGDYILTIENRARNAEGVYQFRLLDISSANEITPGTPVSGILSPSSETDLYRFNATAGERFFFDIQSRSGQSYYANWRLLDPDGSQVFLNRERDIALTLFKTGTYTLLFEGSPFDRGSGSYSFNIQPIINAVPESLTIGNTISGEISTSGGQNSYTFNLTENSKLYFDFLTAQTSLTWSLRGPNGSIISNKDVRYSDWNYNYYSPLMNLDAGDYTLTIEDSTGNTKGTYQFRLLDIASATEINIGTPVSGTLSPSSETDLYQFSATAGQYLYFDIQSRSGESYNASLRLLAPDGSQVFMNSVDIALTLSQTGTYTLLFEGYPFDGGSGSYSFNIQPVINPAPESIIIGNTISGSIPSPAIQQSYIFNLSANSKLYFDFLTAQTSLTWSLSGPNGDIISNKDIRTSDWYYNQYAPIMSLGAGDYTLTIDGIGDSTGYQFRLLDISSANEITPGTPVSGILSPSSETDLYRFNATAGERFFFDIQSLSGESYNVNWRLLAPDGSQIFQNRGGDIDTQKLSQTGTYILLFEGSPFNSGSGSYSFNVQPVIDPIPEPLTLNSTINGSIDTVGSEKRYTFNLSSASRLYFDSLTNDYNFTWTLIGANGIIVNSQQLPSSDIYNSSPVLNLATGDYTITIDASLDKTGAYVFRLLDLANATVINPGTPVSGTLESSKETDLYQFQVSAGDKFYFDRIDVSGSNYNSHWRLLDPDGNVVFNRSFGAPYWYWWSNNNSNDVDTLPLSKTGTYTLMIEGNNYDSDSGSYTFNVQPVGVDLRITDITIPDSVNPGETISLSWTVINQGNLSINGVLHDAIYLSEDPTLDASDLLLGSQIVPTIPLDPNQSYTQTFSVALPTSLPTKGQYLLIATDRFNNLQETNEANNVQSIALRVNSPDLIISNISAPSQAQLGETFPIAWTVKNQGLKTALADWFDRAYLSKDNQWDASDLLLTTQSADTQTPLAADGQYSLSTNITIPNTGIGDYYLLFASDATNIQTEANESNNLFAQAITLKAADLQISNVSIDAVGIKQSGEQVNVSWTVLNTGTSEAKGSWVDRVYLSRDSSLNTATLLASITRNTPLGVGETYDVSTQITLPSVTDGNYKIIVFTDTTNALLESNEENNLKSTNNSLEIGHPDLLASIGNVANTATSGTTIPLNWRITNQGTAETLTSWTDRIYLSADTTFDASDLFLGQFNAPNLLAAGASYDATANLNLPLNASGNRYLLLVTDAGNTIPEQSGETNNTVSSAIAITLAPYADLITSSVTIPGLVIGDPATVLVGWTVSNQGTGLGVTTTWSDRIIASKDNIVGNGDDIVLGNFQHSGALGVGNSYSRNESILLPTRFEGQYNLFVQTDAAGQVFENSLESNNSALANNPLKVALKPYADLVISSVTPGGTNASSGQPFTVAWTVANQGIGTTDSSSWGDRLWLTSDPAGKNIVAQLGTFQHIGTLAVGGNYSRSAEIILPNGISGTYYLAVETGGPYEFLFRDNNTTVSSALQVTLTPPPDLTVTEITAPTAVQSGECRDPMDRSDFLTGCG
jgi:subtilase family serine protease